MANPMNSIARVLGGGGTTSTQSPGRVPHFGPAIAAVKPPASPMSLGGGSASPGVQDMLSRPKRTRSKGYKKTAERPGSAKAGKMANLGALPALASLASASGGSGAPGAGPMA